MATDIERGSAAADSARLANSASEAHYEATPTLVEVRQADLSPGEREVPESLAQLLATHGSEARLDSRRYLRRAQWSRVTAGAHALAAAAIPLELAIAANAAPAIALALVAGIAAAALVAMSHRAMPGAHPLREMVALAAAGSALAALSSLTPALMDLAGVDTVLAATAHHGAAIMLAAFAALTVVAGLAHGQQPTPHSSPRLVRFAAGMTAVMAVLAAAN